MNVTTYIKVPRNPGKRLRILVRDPAWVAKSFDAEVDWKKHYDARAYFADSRVEDLIGTIVLSEINLEFVAHECCHAAWYLLMDENNEVKDEERLCVLTGELTLKVWLQLMKVMNERAKKAGA